LLKGGAARRRSTDALWISRQGNAMGASAASSRAYQPSRFALRLGKPTELLREGWRAAAQRA